jgi:hypothetical protein
VDLDEYVAARYGRLVEHAVLLGAPEGEAGTYVDRVILDNRRRIRRAKDPDPIVFAALEQALSGERPRSRGGGPLVAVGLVLVAVVVAVLLAYRPGQPERLPSLFAMGADQARSLLVDRGYDVVLRPSRACEPKDLVVASDPVPGSLVDGDATVTVRYAVPSGSDCEARFGARTEAWAFVEWAARQGRPPAFADEVEVVVDGQTPRTIRAPESRARWGDALAELRRTADQTPRTATGMAVLEVVDDVPPEDTCGVPRPVDGERRALRLEVNLSDTGGGGCPLTIDLYRDQADAIDEVAIYSATSY